MSRCGTHDRPHRPKRVYGTDDRGRQVVLGQKCECGTLFNRDGRPIHKFNGSPKPAKGWRRLVEHLRLQRKLAKARERAS